MAIQGIENSIKNRLPSTIEVLDKKVSITDVVEEVRLIHGYDDVDEKDLTKKEILYIACLATKQILRAALDRYMQDPKAKGSGGDLDIEYQDKLKYLKKLFEETQSDIDLLAVKLGKSTAGKGTPPPLILKVSAADESGS